MNATKPARAAILELAREYGEACAAARFAEIVRDSAVAVRRKAAERAAEDAIAAREDAWRALEAECEVAS